MGLGQAEQLCTLSVNICSCLYSTVQLSGASLASVYHNILARWHQNLSFLAPTPHNAVESIYREHNNWIRHWNPPPPGSPFFVRAQILRLSQNVVNDFSFSVLKPWQNSYVHFNMEFNIWSSQTKSSMEINAFAVCPLNISMIVSYRQSLLSSDSGIS